MSVQTEFTRIADAIRHAFSTTSKMKASTFADNINKLLNSKDKLSNGKDFFNNYIIVLNSLGVEVDPVRLKSLLTIDNSFDPKNDYLVIEGLLLASGEIARGITKGKVKDEITEDGEKVPGDLIHTYEYQ